ncbi:MAG: outer membrane lipoprotein carrier protein LolA [Elusimicrobia bacterium]|nr:outer membrane lipoprotein carrier protein LolA [Elusimicrobiota bacterium]
MKKFIILLTVCIAMAAAAVAADKKADDIIAHMSAAEKNIKTIVFDYNQEIVYSLTKERQVMRGTVSSALPEKLVVQQTGPLRQDIITDGKKVWVYTPEYRQALMDDFKRWSKSSVVPASLLKVGHTAGAIRKKYAVTVVGEEGGAAIVEMAPLNKDAWRMKVWIDLQTYLPQRAVFDGDSVTISIAISNYRINTPLDPGIFTFTAPDGVEVIQIP